MVKAVMDIIIVLIVNVMVVLVGSWLFHLIEKYIEGRK